MPAICFRPLRAMALGCTDSIFFDGDKARAAMQARFSVGGQSHLNEKTAIAFGDVDRLRAVFAITPGIALEDFLRAARDANRNAQIKMRRVVDLSEAERAQLWDLVSPGISPDRRSLYGKGWLAQATRQFMRSFGIDSIAAPRARALAGSGEFEQIRLQATAQNILLGRQAFEKLTAILRNYDDCAKRIKRSIAAKNAAPK